MLSSCGSIPKDQTSQQPNVIYVFPDQFRNSAMQFWNSPEFRDKVNFKADPVYTPHLNRFAAESCVLTSAVSNCPISSPHRGSLMTGMYPNESGVPLNCNSTRPISSLPSDRVCLSDVFNMAGYDCAYIGKLHTDYPTPNDPARPGKYVSDILPVWDAYTAPDRRHGFDFWYSYGTFDEHKNPHYWDTEGVKHSPREWSPKHEADKAISYLNNRKKGDKPFFMMIAMNPPHSPYRSLEDCMEEDYNLYKDMPLDSLFVRPNADKSMEKTACAPYYFASVTGVDREFGRILDALERSGMSKNTIVVFTSDHGETLCSQATNDPKNSPYTEAMNVPFIVRYPGKIKHKTDDILISTPDIMPTLAGLCGIENHLPDDIHGINYSGLFFDKPVSNLPSSALYIQNLDGEKDSEGLVRSYFPVSRGIKTQRYTLALYIDRKTKKLTKTLLFDDLNDPYQMNNLSLESDETLKKTLLTELASQLKSINDPWYTDRVLADMIPY